MKNKIELISFADVAHQHITFDRNYLPDSIILKLIDTKWVQRLKQIKQTGYTSQVYPFAEHSRFGHSLGVAFLASQVLKNLKEYHPEKVRDYEVAISAASILHDIGHLAPGSHLAERVWKENYKNINHETITRRIILEDPDIGSILDSFGSNIKNDVIKILAEDDSLPSWTHSIISGDGWNADRGNWAIVDSAMCAVTYGRYNVNQLIEAYRIDDLNRLVIKESRLDALTHFYVARDSMYRQVYQHRVIQTIDTIACNIIKRVKFLSAECRSEEEYRKRFEQLAIFADADLIKALMTNSLEDNLPISSIYTMNESWWNYHLMRWQNCNDQILKDLSARIIERKLFKNLRFEESSKAEMINKLQGICRDKNLDPEYYLSVIDTKDKHRKKSDLIPLVLLDSGEIKPVSEVEPLIAKLHEAITSDRGWIAVPKEVKDFYYAERS